MRIEHDRRQIESELFAITRPIRKSRNARPENIRAISASAQTAGTCQLSGVSQLTFWLRAPMREVGCARPSPAREPLRRWRGVMNAAKTERPGWSCTSHGPGVIIYLILVTFLMLSWAYIPA